MATFGLLSGNTLFAVSAFAACIAVALVVRHRSGNTEQGSGGPQNIHLERTSRLGGVAVFAGYVVAIGVGRVLELIALLPAVSLLVAALPVYVAGLWEDVAHRVSPRDRLLAALISAALASMFAQGVVTRLDLPYVDDWLAYFAFALPLTLFMVVGACNAFNIIDGTHGLAGGTALLLSFGLALVAWNAGDRLVLAQAAAMTGALAGFLLWNYPRGKIFLGDAGAYFVGFMYAQLSIQLIARNTGISAWFVIALAAYPIFETLYTIYRRKFVRHTAAMQPDVMHLHSLVYVCVLRFVQRPRPGDRRRGVSLAAYAIGERRRSIRGANARVAPLLWLHGGFCFVNALYFHDNTRALIGFICLYGILYVICYRSAALLSAGKLAPQPIASLNDPVTESRAQEPAAATVQPSVVERIAGMEQPLVTEHADMP